MEVLTKTSRNPDERLVFGDLSLDLANREVITGGQVRRLEPRAAQLLALLLRSPRTTVSRSDLIDALGVDENGSDEALSQAIARLRRILGDDARAPRFITTVPKLGYRWIAAPWTTPAMSAKRRPAPFPAMLAWGAAALSVGVTAGAVATVALTAAAPTPRQFKTVLITRQAGQTTTRERIITTAHPEQDPELIRIERHLMPPTGR